MSLLEIIDEAGNVHGPFETPDKIAVLWRKRHRGRKVIARAVLAALIVINVIGIIAFVDGRSGRVWGNITMRNINAAEPNRMISENTEIVPEFHEAENIKFERGALNVVNLSPVQSLLDIHRSETRSLRGYRALSAERKAGIGRFFWQAFSDPNTNRASRDESLPVAGVGESYPHRERLIGDNWERAYFLNLNVDGRALALNKSPSLNYAYASQAGSKSGNPPSEPNHSVWISEGTLPKPARRALLLLAALAISITALEVLFSPHSPSWLAILGAVAFFGVPVALFLGLQLIG